MIKDTILALLGAALIQRPFWSLATGLWEIAVTYLMTVWVLYILIVNSEEWLNGKNKRPRERQLPESDT